MSEDPSLFMALAYSSSVGYFLGFWLIAQSRSKLQIVTIFAIALFFLACIANPDWLTFCLTTVQLFFMAIVPKLQRDDQIKRNAKQTKSSN